MQKVLYLIFFLTFFSSSYAGDSTNSVQFIATVNCTKFAKQFLSLSNSNLEVSPYLVGMRAGYLGHWLRLQYGIDFSSSSNSNSDFSNTTNIFNQDIRVGYQKEIPLSNKFSSFLGPDLLLNSFQNKTTSNGSGNYTEQNNRSTGFGVGINMGVQWNITKRISLYTEAMINSMYNKGSLISISEFNGNRFVSTTSTEQSSVGFTPPTSIFFHFKF